MKINRVRATAYPQRAFDGLVEIHTDEGLTGIAVGTGDAGAAARKLGSDMLVGEDPRAVSALWQKLQSGKSDPTAIALLDLALWDLKAKANGEPLWKTLGATQPRANAYISLDDSFGDFESAERYGFREGKLSVAADVTAAAKQLESLRDALSKNTAYPVLMIDAGDRWTPQEAISKITELEKDFDLTWIECDDAAWDQEELRQVSDNVSAAVCASGFSASDPHATDIVELNLLVSGITGTLQIADAAYGFELPVTLAASPGNVAAHVAGALPNFMSMEVPVAALAGASISDVVIEDGRARAGEKPGLGLVGAAE